MVSTTQIRPGLLLQPFISCYSLRVFNTGDLVIRFLKNKGTLSIDSLALDANMSLRNFKRKFIDEVGVSPKFYNRITKFYNAVENKMLHTEKSWTTISHESGYFDQAHFIKECKEFASKNPEELFKFTPPPTENIMKK